MLRTAASWRSGSGWNSGEMGPHAHRFGSKRSIVGSIHAAAGRAQQVGDRVVDGTPSTRDGADVERCMTALVVGPACGRSRRACSGPCAEDVRRSVCDRCGPRRRRPVCWSPERVEPGPVRGSACARPARHGYRDGFQPERPARSLRDPPRAIAKATGRWGMTPSSGCHVSCSCGARRRIWLVLSRPNVSAQRRTVL
jgi:hypothetical protein